jgi:hypothetical protein
MLADGEHAEEAPASAGRGAHGTTAGGGAGGDSAAIGFLVCGREGKNNGLLLYFRGGGKLPVCLSFQLSPSQTNKHSLNLRPARLKKVQRLPIQKSAREFCPCDGQSTVQIERPLVLPPTARAFSYYYNIVNLYIDSLCYCRTVN